MRRHALVPGARRTACLLLVLVFALAGVVVSAPRAQARPPLGTVRDLRVTKAADEVLTVDVLGVDEPPAGQTWVRSSVCLWDGVCARSLSADGVTSRVNDDGTITSYRTAGGSGTTVVGYTVEDTSGGRYGARLLVTDTPVAAPLATEPDPTVKARLRVTRWKRFVYFDHAGQVVRLTSTVSNKGNVALEGLTLSSASPSIPARTCAPVPVGGTLPAGASTTCTALLTVTQDLVDLGVRRIDQVTATGRAVRGGTTYLASASTVASAVPLQLPGLSLTASVDPATVASATEPAAYTFVARNRGKVTLRNLLVRAPFPGLSAVVCAPVPLGGALAPGQTTTCRASRTVPPGRTSLTDTVRASAQTYRQTVNATSRTSVAVPVPPPAPPPSAPGSGPVARPDAVPVRVGHPVVVDVLGNDSTGSSGAPLVGASVRLRLTPELGTTAQLYGDTKTLIVPPVFNRPVEPLVGGAAFLVSGRGEITVVPLSDATREPFTVGYQVTDANGATSRSTLTVTLTP